MLFNRVQMRFPEGKPLCRSANREYPFCVTYNLSFEQPHLRCQLQMIKCCVISCQAGGSMGHGLDFPCRNGEFRSKIIMLYKHHQMFLALATPIAILLTRPELRVDHFWFGFEYSKTTSICINSEPGRNGRASACHRDIMFGYSSAVRNSRSELSGSLSSSPSPCFPLTSGLWRPPHPGERHSPRGNDRSCK